MTDPVLVRVTAPSFVAGLILGQRAAPVIRYMREWTLDEVFTYARVRGWRVEVITPTRIRLRDGDLPEWWDRYRTDWGNALRWAARQGEADME